MCDKVYRQNQTLTHHMQQKHKKKMQDKGQGDEELLQLVEVPDCARSVYEELEDMDQEVDTGPHKDRPKTCLRLSINGSDTDNEVEMERD